MRLNVNPQRFRRQRRTRWWCRPQWQVRVSGASMYEGDSSWVAFRILSEHEASGLAASVIILRYGRRVWPPADELPLGHL